MLHELCHAAAAYGFGLRIREIEMFPFGGVARIDDIDSAGPFREVIISIAGPMLNVFAAALLFFLHNRGIKIPYFEFVMDLNIALTVFNLLPGLPLDGGRILRAALTYYTGYRKATRTAVLTGKLIAIIIFTWGTIALLAGNTNISLLVMPFFIYISAKKEEDFLMYTVIKDVVNKKSHIKNKKIMDTVEICVYETAYIREVLKHFDLNKYHLIIIIDSNMKVLDILTESQVVDSISTFSSNMTVGELARKIKN
jgi:Zn-dependent proteases